MEITRALLTHLVVCLLGAPFAASYVGIGLSSSRPAAAAAGRSSSALWGAGAENVCGEKGVEGVPKKRATTKKLQRPSKMRADEILVRRGIAVDAKEAAALCMAGDVFVKNDQRVSSPATKLAETEVFRIRQRKGHMWASRGGLKLEHAVKDFDLVDLLRGASAIDVGCSTGGFTDVLLHFGARRVFAVDVGYCLLDYRLRMDKRVKVLERQNARYLTREHVDEEAVDVVVCDASFISLELVLPAAMGLVRPGGSLVCLVKPQFEAEREDVGEGGLVASDEIHQQVCGKAKEWLSAQRGWRFRDMIESPIRGAERGNIEFLMHGVKEEE